jgi:spermidine/putrescine transport system substrate-binding protein
MTMHRLVLLLATLATALAFPFSAAGAGKDEFHLYNWNNYLAPETVKRFEDFCKCTVVQTYYSDNEELLAKLSAGAKGYDVYVPTSNAVQALIKSGRLKAIDKAQLPNLKNIDPRYLDTPFDPGNKFSVPYAMSTTIIGYNDEKARELGLPTDTWAVIFDPKHLEKVKGRVTVLDSANELFAAALKYLGYSANDVDPKHWDEAVAVIKKAKPYWAAFNASSYIKELTVGNIWLVHGYSNDIFQANLDAQAAGRKFRILQGMPKEGAVLAVDNMVIDKSAPRARSRDQVHELHARGTELRGAHQPHRLRQSQHGRGQVHQARASQESGDLPGQGRRREARAAAGPHGRTTPAAQQAVDRDQSRPLIGPAVPVFRPHPRGRKSLLPHCLAALYGLAIGYASLQPFTNWMTPLAGTPYFLGAPFPSRWVRYDFVINTLAYLPFGFFVGLMPRQGSATRRLTIAIVVGALLSLVMESLQMYLPTRFASTFDLISNTVGAALGGLLAGAVRAVAQCRPLAAVGARALVPARRSR